ncbi:MAG: alkaline phosphatase family protein [Gaiellaceae bacterium]
MSAKKLVLIVIDGLTPGVFENAVERGEAPALSELARHGEYVRAVSTFPSLTPVCLASLATGAHPSGHRIPHLVWYQRAERRFVEYGSSFAAVRAVGTRRSIRDTVIHMNRDHLSPGTPTVFETLEAAGLETAGVNMTCYRGPHMHRPLVPGVMPPAAGPRRFFYFSLFESDRTGAPIAVGDRAGGSIDAYAAIVGRWLVTRDGFDFLVYYLPDHDFASHRHGPLGTRAALARSDAAVGALLEAAGGLDEFLSRYAVVLCSDHGQTPVSRGARLEDAFAGFRLARPRGGFADDELAIAASNRVGMVYRLDACRTGVEELVARAERAAGVDLVAYREGEEAVVRRQGEMLRFQPAAGGWATSGDTELLSEPNALERVWHALTNPQAGEVIVAAAEGVVFADLGGRHHAGGGSHGSLAAGDSEVPMLSVGLGRPPRRIVDVAPLVVSHFGAVAGAPARAA